MSCCCNNSSSGLPCCCPANYSVTTTTTCPFGICCDPSCNNAEICDEAYSSDCAIYSGPEIESDCFTIQSGMNLTEILETVMIYICPTTTTTTTVCQRPSELLPFILMYSVDCTGTYINFTSSFASACQAVNDLYNTPGCNLGGSVVFIVSLSVGQIVYAETNPLSCIRVSDGYYVYTQTNAADALIVHIVNGIIDSITTC